jgi:anti-sigma B factor antagonist
MCGKTVESEEAMDGVLHVDVQSLNGSTLIAVVGEVDIDSMPELQATLDELSIERQILVDLSGVLFMDSSGLNVLLRQRTRMTEKGGSIYICNPSPAVQRLVEITGLDDVLYAPDAVTA